MDCSEREREKSHSPRRTGNEEDSNILLGDELSDLGFPEDIEAMQVFEPTGKHDFDLAGLYKDRRELSNVFLHV